MNQLQKDTIRLFADLKVNDPDRYREILDYECPHDYGLPSYNNTDSCADHTCEDCWKEALGK